MDSLEIDSLSITYSINRSGPTTENWGTTIRIIVAVDILLLMTTACERFMMKNSFQKN